MDNNVNTKIFLLDISIEYWIWQLSPPPKKKTLQYLKRYSLYMWVYYCFHEFLLKKEKKKPLQCSLKTLPENTIFRMKFSFFYRVTSLYKFPSFSKPTDCWLRISDYHTFLKSFTLPLLKIWFLKNSKHGIYSV